MTKAKRRSAHSERVTIKDVALRAGTSVTTVSNVLNGRTYAMTEDTLARIQDAMRELKFRPNRVAQGLVTRRTATLGVILAEIETPLFLQALPAMELDARQAGYSLLLCNARHEADETFAALGADQTGERRGFAETRFTEHFLPLLALQQRMMRTQISIGKAPPTAGEAEDGV